MGRFREDQKRRKTDNYKISRSLLLGYCFVIFMALITNNKEREYAQAQNALFVCSCIIILLVFVARRLDRNYFQWINKVRNHQYKILDEHDKASILDTFTALLAVIGLFFVHVSFDKTFHVSALLAIVLVRILVVIFRK
jgi:hypothetical protein